MTDLLATDVLTTGVIKRAIRELRRMPPPPRCPHCGEIRQLHIRIHPNADPALQTYARDHGWLCES